MQYSKEMTQKAYEKAIEEKELEIESIEELIEYDEETRELTLHFAGGAAEDESVAIDGESMDISVIESAKEDKYISLFLIPEIPITHKITGVHSENYSNYAEVKAKARAAFSANAGGFLSYDGKDAATTTEWGNYAVALFDTNEVAEAGLFQNQVRVAKVNAKFDSNANHINKTVEIKIGKGFSIAGAPGLKVSATDALWEADLANLPDEIKAFVSGVTFTREADSLKYNKSQGGTIVYHLKEGAENIPINIQLIGHAEVLDSGSADLGGAPPNASGVSTELVNLVDAITARSTYEDKASPGTPVEINTGKIDSIKVFGGRMTYHFGLFEYYTNPGAVLELTPTIAYSGGSGIASFISGTVKYKYPKNIEVQSVVAHGDTAHLLNNVDYSVTSFDATHNILTITVGEGQAMSELSVKVKSAANIPVGTYVFEYYDGDMVYPLSPSGKTPIIHGIMNMFIIVAEPKLDKIQHTSLLDIAIKRNYSPSNVNYPLGGFSIKNPYAEDLVDQRLKYVFDDPNISVTAITIFSSANIVKDVKIITRERGAGAPILLSELSNPTPSILIEKSLKDIDPSVSATDSILEMSFQMPMFAKGATIGYDGLRQHPFGYLSYYGRVDAGLADGDSFTAKLLTTTPDDPNFTGAGSATTPEIGGVQQTIVTTTLNNDPNLKGGIVLYPGWVSTNYNNNLAAGEALTLKASYQVEPRASLYVGGVVNVGYIKGYDFFLKKIPYVDYQTGSFKVKDYETDDEYYVLPPVDVPGTNGEVLKFSVPSLVVSDNVGGLSGVNRTFVLELGLAAAKNAPFVSYNMTDYLQGFPIDPDIVNAHGYSKVLFKEDSNDLNKNGNTAELGLTLGDATQLTISSKTPFSLSTAARLNTKDSGGNTVIGDWGLYDPQDPASRIVLNPDGEADFGFFMSNSSAFDLTSMTAYIPIPKQGGVVDANKMPASPADYNPSEHIQDKPFEWDVLLNGEVKVSGSFTNVDVFYSLSYEIDDTDSASWKTWASLSSADRASVKTVIIKSKSAAGPGSDLVATVPLGFNKLTADQYAGAINTYSAYVYRNLDGSGSVPSEPVSIVLKTGVISGFVYNDVNNNGLKDPAEAGLYNFEVKAYLAGTDTLVDTVRTDAAGFYRFNGLDKTEKVDIVYDRTLSNPGWKFTGMQTVATDGDTAKWGDLTPSDGSYGPVNAGLSEPYILNFDITTGDGTAPANIVNYYGESFAGAPAAPTKTNFVFNGWYTVDTGGTKVDLPTGTEINKIFADQAFPARTQTLFAQWRPAIADVTTQHYTFSDDIAQATHVAAHDTVVQKNYGESFTAAKVTMAGYAFVSADPAETITVAGDTIIKMYYQAGMEDIAIEHYTYVNDPASSTKVRDTSTSGRVDRMVVIAKETIEGHSYDHTTPALTPAMEYKVVAGTNLVKVYYKANTYPVEYITDNGTASTKENLPFGTLATVQAAPSKTGYTFTGAWHKPDGTAWKFATDTIPVGGIVLTAKYGINSYNATFVVNGGTALPAGQETATYVYNTALTEPTTTRPGYIFDGWFDGNTKWNFATGKMPAGNLTLTAKWTVNTNDKVTFTFDLQGGKFEGTTNNPKQLLNAGQTPENYRADQVTRTGMVVLGWYTEEAYTNQWVFGTPLEHNLFKNTTLYAQWIPDTVNPMIVTFDLAGGTHSDSTDIANQSIIVGGSVSEPQGTMAKLGHTFKFWAKSDIQWNFDTVFNSSNFGNMTLVAKWETNNYQISFDPDNGGGLITGDYKYDTLIPAPTQPTKPGHTFDGWYNGTEKWDFATSKVPAGDFTLKAKWTTNVYNLSVDADNGDNPTTQQVAFNELAIDPGAPTKVGYTFEGWYNDTVKWNFATSKMPARDTDLKAKWTIKSYLITVNHYTYTNDVATAVLKESKPSTINHFVDFTAERIVIPYHTFIAADSDPISFKVDAVKTVNLYYKADSYTMALAKNQLELIVNDKYPVAASYKPTWAAVVEMLGVTTNNSNSGEQRIKAGSPAPVLESPDYDKVNFSAITTGYSESFTINAKWPNGSTDSAVVAVKLVDKKAPEILNLTDNRRLFFDADQFYFKSEAELYGLVKNLNVTALDNYDGAVKVSIGYPEGQNFASIKWSEAGEYGIYIEAKDSSGNTSRKVLIISMVRFPDDGGIGGDGGTSKPDPNPTPGGENVGDGDDVKYLGNYIDKDGNLRDQNGNLVGGTIPEDSLAPTSGMLLPNAGGFSLGILAVIGLIILVAGIFLKRRSDKKNKEGSEHN